MASVVEYKRGDGKVFYQPKRDDGRRYCYWSTGEWFWERIFEYFFDRAWALNTGGAMDPILYRSKARALAVAERSELKLIRKDLKVVEEVR